MSDPTPLPPPQVRSVSDIHESDPDFEEQLMLVYPNLSKRKDRLKSYKAQREVVDDEAVPIGDKIVKFAGRIAGRAKEKATDTVADVKAAREAKGASAASADTDADQFPASLDAPIPSVPQPALRPFQEITEHDPDFDAQLVLLYPNLSKPKDRVKTFRAQRKSLAVADQQTAQLEAMTPQMRQVEEWMTSVPLAGVAPAKEGRLREIYQRIAETDETPIIAMRAELVGSKEQTTVFGGKKQNDTATFQSGSGVLTDKRFYMETRLLMSRDSQTIMLRDIQGVTRQTGFGNLQDIIEIRTSGGVLKFSTGLRNRAETEKLIDLIQTTAAEARADETRASQSMVPLVAQTSTKAQQLKELFELHQMGGLTDEEYAAAKAQVLGG